MKKIDEETIKALRNAQSQGLSLRKAAKSLGLSVGTVHNYWQATETNAQAIDETFEQCSNEQCSNDTEPSKQASETAFEQCSNEQCSNEIVQMKKAIEQLQNAIEQLQARITAIETRQPSQPSQPAHLTRPTRPTNQEITSALAKLYAHFKEYAKLAKALGLSPNTVRNWFNGYTPSTERQKMILKLLEEVHHEHGTIENCQP